MLEVVDSNDKPLLLQLYKEAKHLPHRFVMLIIQDNTGKLLLWRHKKKKRKEQLAHKKNATLGAVWGLLYGHVHAGEARESTALRLLKKHLPALAELGRIREELPHMEGDPIQLHKLKLEEPFTRQNYMTFFRITLRKEEKALLSEELLWLDLDEIQGFSAHFADMLTPITLQLARSEYMHTLYGLSHK